MEQPIIENNVFEFSSNSQHEDFDQMQENVMEVMLYFNRLKLNVKTKNDIFKMIAKLLDKGSRLLKSMINNAVVGDPIEIIDAYNDFMQHKICDYSTVHKRTVIARSLPTYVEPIPYHASM